MKYLKILRVTTYAIQGVVQLDVHQPAFGAG